MRHCYYHAATLLAIKNVTAEVHGVHYLKLTIANTNLCGVLHNKCFYCAYGLPRAIEHWAN